MWILVIINIDRVYNWFKPSIRILWLIDWEVYCVLARPDLWKRMLLKCSINMVFTCSLLSWCKISSPFREDNNVVVFRFLSISSCRWPSWQRLYIEIIFYFRLWRYMGWQFFFWYIMKKHGNKQTHCSVYSLEVPY